MRRLVSVVMVVVLVLVMMVVSSSVIAAKDAKTPVESTPPPSPKLGLKIAILPFEVTGAREATKEMLPELYKTLFETQGFDVTMGVPVEQAMQKLDIRTTGIPTSKELLRIGESLGVDYILFASHKFSTKRIWVILMPRARSELTLDPMIISVKLKEVVYEPKNKIGYARGGSNAQTGIGLVVFYPAALFMGGSLGDTEKKALVNTIKTAYDDFFQSLVSSTKSNKIE